MFVGVFGVKFKFHTKPLQLIWIKMNTWASKQSLNGGTSSSGEELVRFGVVYQWMLALG